MVDPSFVVDASKLAELVEMKFDEKKLPRLSLSVSPSSYKKKICGIFHDQEKNQHLYRIH